MEAEAEVRVAEMAEEAEDPQPEGQITELSSLVRFSFLSFYFASSKRMPLPYVSCRTTSNWIMARPQRSHERGW